MCQGSEQLASQGEGHDRVAVNTASPFLLSYQNGFKILWIGDHLAPGNLFRGSVVIAQLANPKTIFGPDRWTEDPTGHWARRVKIARARLGIQHRAYFVVGKGVEFLTTLGTFIEKTGVAISGEDGAEAFHRLDRPPPHSLGPLAIN